MKIIITSLLVFALLSCQEKPKKARSSEVAIAETEYKTTGSIERLNPAINNLIPQDAKIEILAGGFTWTEGPLWISDGGYLLFSDIPPNQIVKWSPTDGISTYLQPSGYTGTKDRSGEPGSNGLLLDKEGKLVLCQHGDRRMARMTAPLDAPKPEFETLIDLYEGKRFNSPNDAVYDKEGNLYFTDPPYGLEGNMSDPDKEINFQGVYRYSTEGVLTLISDKIPRPNGIGLSPDEKTLYVASSQLQPMWTAFAIDATGSVKSSRIFYDSSERDAPGAPDGLKVDKSGNIWATGPGGVWIFSPSGVILGKIRTGERTSNCAFGPNEDFLYMTCDDYLMRIKLKAS